MFVRDRLALCGSFLKARKMFSKCPVKALL
jgi:hypothetical protein